MANGQNTPSSQSGATPDPWAALGAVPAPAPSTPTASGSQTNQDPWAALGAVPAPAPQMVTNSAGETMPADVAARHALTRAGKAPEQPEGVGTALAVGAGKSAAQTVEGLGNLVNKILPRSVEIPTSESVINKTLPASAAKEKELAVASESYQPEGVAETVGNIGENILEFAGGEEALKGLSLAEKLGKLTKLAEFLEANPRLAQAAHIGGNILRSGTVGAVQGGVKGAAEGDATGGAVGGGIGGLAGGATGEVLSGLGKGVQAVKTLMARNPALAEQGAAIVKGLTDDATPEQIARTVAKNLDDAETAMRSRYDAGFKAVANNAKDVSVPIAGSPLQSAAKELLGETSRLPESMAESLKGVSPDMEKIEPLLKNLADSKETFTWDQLEATRQKIGAAFRDEPYSSPLRRPLNTLRSSIDDTMEKAASDANKLDLSKQIKAVRADYAKNVNALDQTAIVALRDKNPNEVANILMNKTSVHNVNTLRTLIGPENMKPVQGSVLQNIMNYASKNGPLDGPMLLRKFNALGEDAKQALWGDKLPQIQKFITEAAKDPSHLQEVVGKVLTKSMLGAGTIGISAYQLGHGDVKGAAKTVGYATLGYALADPVILDKVIKALEATGGAAPSIVGGVAQGSGADQGIGNWIKYTLSDGRTTAVHPEDQAELLRQDPGARKEQ